MGTDVDLGNAALQTKIRVEQVKATQNAWIGPELIARLAGEVTVIYCAAIVLDSIGHFGGQIAKLLVTWEGNSWIILSSFIVVSPVTACPLG